MLTGRGKWLMVTVVATCAVLAVAIVVLAALVLQRIAAPGSTMLTSATAAIEARIDSLTDTRAGRPNRNPPVRSGNPVDWFGPDDYPPEAKRNGVEGTVRFRLTIDAAGHATSCAILESSGSVALDKGTCRLASARAELKPLPQTGRPPERLIQSVRWQLAD